MLRTYFRLNFFVATVCLIGSFGAPASAAGEASRTDALQKDFEARSIERLQVYFSNGAAGMVPTSAEALRITSEYTCSVQLNDSSNASLLAALRTADVADRKGINDFAWGVDFLSAQGVIRHSIYMGVEWSVTHKVDGTLDGVQVQFSNSLIHWLELNFPTWTCARRMQ